MSRDRYQGDDEGNGTGGDKRQRAKVDVICESFEPAELPQGFSEIGGVAANPTTGWLVPSMSSRRASAQASASASRITIRWALHQVVSILAGTQPPGGLFL